MQVTPHNLVILLSSLEYLPPPKLGLNLDDRVDFVVFRKEQCRSEIVSLSLSPSIYVYIPLPNLYTHSHIHPHTHYLPTHPLTHMQCVCHECRRGLQSGGAESSSGCPGGSGSGPNSS